MTFYNTDMRFKFYLIPIQEIMLTPSIKNVLNNYQYKNISQFEYYNDNAVKLNRMEDGRHGIGMINLMRTNVKLPLVTVYEYKQKNNIIYYAINDGRHRFTASILYNFTHIPALIIKNNNEFINEDAPEPPKIKWNPK